MKKILFFSVAILLFSSLQMFSQTTIQLQPGPEGKDAQVWSIMPDMNIGNTPKFLASGWTHSGEPGVNRAFIDFDLSAIPENAIITEARLNLYFVCLEPNFFGHTGQNDAQLMLITEPWEEDFVTWNNQPATTQEHQVNIPQSADPYMDYNDLDITALIQNLYAEPELYHGLMLRLMNENPYRCILFASSDYSDTISMRPMLEITYSTESNTIVIQPGQEGKDALVWSAYPQYHFGDSPKFTCMTWSHYKESCTTRALVEFDLSALPPDVTITSAKLSLYFVCQESTYMGHTGENESWLQLITEPWTEEEVTWDYQPATTSNYQVVLPASTDPFMDYTNIDVTELINMQYTEPENYHGFLLRLANESIYRSLLFASGDYTDTIEFRPKLEVSYILNSTIVIIQPAEEGKDAQLWSITPDQNYGDIPKFACMGWTHSGSPGVNRGLVEFDLSVIPPGAQITDAKLNFYFVCLEPTYFGHTGQNDAYLQLITEPWDEHTVTWNNQPSITESDQIHLPASSDPYMDYTDIDVTGLVNKLYSEPEDYHGFMFRLQNENPYRCLLFASGDYMDTVEMHPKLVITYTMCQQPVANFTYQKEDYSVYFQDESMFGEMLYWDFGDGYYSDLLEPWHIYDNPGIYQVCLTTWNSCGEDSTCQVVSVGNTYDQPDAELSSYHTFPNPARDYLSIASKTEAKTEISLLNPNGQVMISKSAYLKNEDITTLDLSGVLDGIYYLRITSANESSVKKIIINK